MLRTMTEDEVMTVDGGIVWVPVVWAGVKCAAALLGGVGAGLAVSKIVSRW
ncbi:hypothetical protein [Howardella ureilytica]|nr:hypothetical protein [Lachnospiraceae bacterium]MDY2956159.1 hypothetical protein [Lachnospiraceae bacterium]